MSVFCVYIYIYSIYIYNYLSNIYRGVTEKYHLHRCFENFLTFCKTVSQSTDIYGTSVSHILSCIACSRECRFRLSNIQRCQLRAV
jgi:hypothetical protein